MSTRLTIVRLMAVAGLSLSLTACGKVTAQMSFKDGIGAYQQQNYRVAIAEFEEAVEHDFEYRPYAYFYLANSHDNAFKFTRKGQPENDAHLPEAEKYYKLAYEQIDPASREGQGAIFKKRCLEYLVGLYGTEKLNTPDKAEAIGKQIVALDPKDVNNYFGMAQLYQDAGRMEEAEQMLMRAKEVAPEQRRRPVAARGLLQQAGQLRQDDGSVPDPHPARAEQPRGVPHGGRLLRGEGPQGLHASARRSRPTTSSAASRRPTRPSTSRPTTSTRW